MRKLYEIFSKMNILSCKIYIRQISETARWESRQNFQLNLLPGSCSLTFMPESVTKEKCLSKRAIFYERNICYMALERY